MDCFDVVIVGGGPVGRVTGLALAREGFSVALIEAKDPRKKVGDTRWFALGFDTIEWLSFLGVEAEYGWIDTIHLSASQEPTPIFFHALQGDRPHLAGMISSDVLQDKLGHLSCRLSVFCPDRVTFWEDKGGGWELSLESGQCVRAPLVIGADGRSSSVRSFFSPSCHQWTFPQKAIVFTFSPFSPLSAHEHFFHGGSLALLPLPEGQGAGIWIGKPDQIPALNLNAEIQALVGSPIEWISTLSFFDVQIMHVSQTTFHRCALLGDAAHTMHPIAGQGLNVGLRNARTLIDHLTSRKRLGLDWGLGLESVRRPWKVTTLGMQAFTTGIVVGLGLYPFPGVWKTGALILNRWPGLARWMIKRATG